MCPIDIAFIGVLCLIFGGNFVQLVGATLLVIAALK